MEDLQPRFPCRHNRNIVKVFLSVLSFAESFMFYSVIPTTVLGLVMEDSSFWEKVTAGGFVVSFYFGYFSGTLILPLFVPRVSRKSLIVLLTALQGVLCILLIFIRNTYSVIVIRFWLGMFSVVDVLIKEVLEKFSMSFNRGWLISWILVAPRNLGIVLAIFVTYASIGIMPSLSPIFLPEITAGVTLTLCAAFAGTFIAGEALNERKQGFTYIEFQNRNISQNNASPRIGISSTNTSPNNKSNRVNQTTEKVFPIKLQSNFEPAPPTQEEFKHPETTLNRRTYYYEKTVLVIAAVIDGMFADLWILWATIDPESGGLGISFKSLIWIALGIHLPLFCFQSALLNCYKEELTQSMYSRFFLLIFTLLYIVMGNLRGISESYYVIAIGFAALLLVERCGMFTVGYYAINLLPRDHSFVSKARYLLKALAGALGTIIISVDSVWLRNVMHGKIIFCVLAGLSVMLLLIIIWKEHCEDLENDASAPRAIAVK